MKISIFIFVIVSTLLLSSFQSQSQTLVLDTNGDPLVSGPGYFILPAESGRGGGLKLVPATQNQTCPLDVSQEYNEHLDGLPLSFLPAVVFRGVPVIHEHADVNIIFAGKWSCGEPAVWRVEDVHGQQVISSRGSVGGPSRETINSWFKIEKCEDAYKIVFCPSVCQSCKPACGDVGSTIAKNERISLILNKEPLKVKFKKEHI